MKISSVREEKTLKITIADDLKKNITSLAYQKIREQREENIIEEIINENFLTLNTRKDIKLQEAQSSKSD